MSSSSIPLELESSNHSCWLGGGAFASLPLPCASLPDGLVSPLSLCGGALPSCLLDMCSEVVIVSIVDTSKREVGGSTDIANNKVPDASWAENLLYPRP